MVKNKKGGSGHKKMARKNVKPTFVKRKLRKSTDALEIYCRVLSIHGGGHADVLCPDKKKRLLVIRGKFRGRNKRDNSIKVNTIVLAGIRDFEVVQAKKKEKVDLLYVYNESDMNELKEIPEVQSILDMSQKTYDDDMPFELTHKEDIKDDIVISSVNKKVVNKSENTTEELEFDFDDI